MVLVFWAVAVVVWCAREGHGAKKYKEPVIFGAGRWQASPGDLGGVLRGESGSQAMDLAIPGSGCCV